MLDEGNFNDRGSTPRSSTNFFFLSAFLIFINVVNKNSIKKSDLKKLTKFILKEISLPQQNKKPQGLLQFLFGTPPSPWEYDIQKSHKSSNDIFVDLRKTATNVILAIKNKDAQSYRDYGRQLENHRHELLTLVRYLVNVIYVVDVTKGVEIDKLMADFKNHLIQFTNQINTIIMSLKNYDNNINAINEINHLNEIFKSLKSVVTACFELGLKVGLKKK